MVKPVDMYQSLQSLKKLEPNWDSYGAGLIDHACIERAWSMYCALPGMDWTAVPCSDGGVQLEQHADGFDIEIMISRAPSREGRNLEG